VKICKFTKYDMYAQMGDGDPETNRLAISPLERAMMILHSSLEAVNQAGLDGKKLEGFEIRETFQPDKHPDDQIIEIHAKVTHRLANPEGRT